MTNTINKKYFISILVVFLVMLFALVEGNRLVPILQDATVVPEDIDKKSYVVCTDHSADDDYNLQIGESDTPVSLVLAAMRPFELYLDGNLVYTYQKDSLYSRLHVISIPSNGGNVHIHSGQRAIKALITSTSRTTSLTLWALAISFVSIGMNFMIFAQSLILYRRKRTEKYLVALIIASTVALISALLTSPISIGISEANYVNVQRLINVCNGLICSVVITTIYQVGRRNRWINLVVHMLCFVLLFLGYVMGVANITIVSTLIFLVYDTYVISHAKDVKESIFISISLAFVYAFAIYSSFTNQGTLPNSELLVFFYTPHLTRLIFFFAVTFMVDGLFARKFNEADVLNVELASINQSLDQTVEERTQQLKHQQEIKNNMTINIFHDLRSPIFGAIGCADMIQTNDEDSKELLGTLKEKLSFISKLIEQLFLIGQLEEGRIVFHDMETDMKQFLAQVAMEFAVDCEEKGIKFVQDLDEDIICNVDAFRIKQAIMNLLSNALKFTTEGSITIKLDADEEYANIHIVDTGKGISEEDIPHLFERYYQGNYSNRSSYAGLGLSIVQGIVEAEHGTVSVISEVGKGSEFIIQLPIAKENDL